MHPLDLLTSTLKEAGYRTHLETSGTHPLSGKWDWICFSPKKFKDPLPEIYTNAHELKVVINHPSDLSWAEKHRSMVDARCLLYMQPEWEKQEVHLPRIIAYVKENPHWRIGLQTHKYLQVP